MENWKVGEKRENIEITLSFYANGALGRILLEKKFFSLKIRFYCFQAFILTPRTLLLTLIFKSIPNRNQCLRCSRVIHSSGVFKYPSAILNCCFWRLLHNAEELS